MSETLSPDLLDQTAGALVEALAARKVGALELTERRHRAHRGPRPGHQRRGRPRLRPGAAGGEGRRRRPGQGERRPLLGLPMTVKESNEVEGLASTWGSPAFSGWVASRDAVAVAAAEGGGRGHSRQDQRAAVPGRLAEHQPDLRPHQEPLGPGPLAGRLVGRQRRGGGRRHEPAGVGLGHRRLDPRARRPSAASLATSPATAWSPPAGTRRPGWTAGPVALAVVGPIARCAADLDLALGVVAGPEPARGGATSSTCRRRATPSWPTTGSWCSTNTRWPPPTTRSAPPWTALRRQLDGLGAARGPVQRPAARPRRPARRVRGDGGRGPVARIAEAARR